MIDFNQDALGGSAQNGQLAAFVAEMAQGKMGDGGTGQKELFTSWAKELFA